MEGNGMSSDPPSPPANFRYSRTSIRYIVIVLVLTLVVTGPIFFKYTFWRDERGQVCHLRAWAQSNAFKIYDFAVSEIAVSIIPMPLILLLNGAIIVKLRCLKARLYFWALSGFVLRIPITNNAIGCNPIVSGTPLLWHEGEECNLM